MERDSAHNLDPPISWLPAGFVRSLPLPTRIELLPWHQVCGAAAGCWSLRLPLRTKKKTRACQPIFYGAPFFVSPLPGPSVSPANAPAIPLRVKPMETFTDIHFRTPTPSSRNRGHHG